MMAMVGERTVKRNGSVLVVDLLTPPPLYYSNKDFEQNSHDPGDKSRSTRETVSCCSKDSFRGPLRHRHQTV